MNALSRSPILRQVASTDRSSALRSRVLSLTTTISMGFRSGLQAGRKSKQFGADGAECCAHGSAFVAAEVVGDDNVAAAQRRREELADPGGEGETVDRPVDDAGRDDAVVPQACEEGERLPMSVRDLGQQRRAARAPTAGARHVGLGPGFIHEDQACGIKPVLMRPPACSSACQVRPVRLAGQQRFF